MGTSSCLADRAVPGLLVAILPQDMRCSWNVHLELHCLHQRHWNCGAVSGEEKLMAGESRV